MWTQKCRKKKGVTIGWKNKDEKCGFWERVEERRRKNAGVPRKKGAKMK